jgi:hypothetical protein
MMSPDGLNSNCDARPPDIQQTFSAIASQFLAQRCTFGTDCHIADRDLFPQFRAFWMATTCRKDHPALLGHYRVVLTEMGYRSRGGKRPHWYGFTLHIDEKEKHTTSAHLPSIGESASREGINTVKTGNRQIRLRKEQEKQTRTFLYELDVSNDTWYFLS